ncbi:putative f5 8 type c domain protein [Lasiodiplodia theobromae]|uniref:F5 8 type c domain protein n=1 Tax=Lasiodiplodia theobromae TaxID=45133 RepID=UPI0015C350FB|nr:F5 8 type c domain protein [Lasiodiplodia theobromae]KAF4540611.1 F5 8 type c domain protein [Lasiodiplodia theobromae]KAF9634889.1 putative f5 8 type c domain protein [Lasiodiplodia theobromae]
MVTSSVLTACSLLPLLAAARINVTSQLFVLAGESTINNVKLTWSLIDDAASYEVLLLSDSGSYDVLATAPGDSWDIYGLTASQTYQIRGVNGSTTIDSSDDVTVAPGSTLASDLSTYDNTVASSLSIKSTLVSGSTYYKYNYVTDSNGFSYFQIQTSTDGYTFTGNTTAITRETVCASIANGFCKLESIAINQHPTTNQVVIWAHFENAADYTLGEVAVLYGDPGDTLTFGGAFRPEGDDSRDLGFFADTDGSGYIITAINTNTNLGLYSLNADWTNVTAKVATIQPGENREAPALVRDGESYYLFSSTAAGWYPSQGKYVSTQASLSSSNGTWTASRNVGNVNTFGAQSGGVSQIGDTYVERANRWAAQWAIPEASNRQVVLPIAFADGLASYHFYRTLRYSDDAGVVVGVQSGKILSVGKTATSSDASTTASVANDGTQDDPSNLFTPAAVPFWWQVDLGDAHSLTQVDITPRQVGGSETYLQYNVTGSTDGESWTLLVNGTANTAVGFLNEEVTDSGSYRYVRLNVNKVINIHNGNEADWAAGLHEVTVYGS